MSKTVKRLITSFIPSHYDLYMHPNRDTATFRGTVTIRGKVVGRPSKRLTFHQKDLQISSAQVIKHDKKGDLPITIDRINLQKKLYEVRLHSSDMVYPGEYSVTMEFSGTITPDMQGIYPSNFVHDGIKKQLITTQFESHHAREAFPCIDEPEAKATFLLKLDVPTGEVAISNTPVKTIKTADGIDTVTFESTPKMSTYLLAFTYGEMHCVERKTKDGVEIRSWSSIAQPKDHLLYSADEAVNILEFFADYFGTPYPLPKLDQVALPDFDAGAMENWGMVTYREIALLADPHNRSISNDQYVSLVVAHELSHQWFGNLVTMRWWDDLWLNESFASLMEHLALDALHPDWQQWEHYTAMDVVSTSSRDVYKDVQAVSVDVTDPDLIETLFDPGIVYAKGGRLLKMLREYIGDDAFKAGLQQYFTKHAYANATREDLWKALSEASKLDVSSIMTPWLIQSGMPVVTVNQVGDQLELNQERFLLDGPADGKFWPVALLADQNVPTDIFKTKHVKETLPSSDFVTINEHGSGHYVVHYANPEHRAALVTKFHNAAIGAEARINILNDMYMLARHGDMRISDALDVVLANKAEQRDNVWALMGRILGAAGQLTEGDTTVEELLKRLRCQLAREAYLELGWDDKKSDDANTIQLRHTMIAYMISGDDPTALAEAVNMYENAESLQAIPAELRGSILVAAVRHGGKKMVDALLSEYDSASPDVQLDITSAVTATRDTDIGEHVLLRALGLKGFVRPQDVMRWLALGLRNVHIRPAAWKFMEDQWDWLKKTMEQSKAFDFLPIYAAGVVSTPEWQQKYVEFFTPKKAIKVLVQNIDVGMADIEARVAWRQREEAAIAEWLERHFPN